MNNAQFPQMLSRKKLPKAKKGDMEHFPKAITLHPKAKHILENHSQDYKKKQANLEFRHDMMQRDRAASRSREIDRLKGILHNHTVRQDAPQGALNNLYRRLVTLQDLGG
jgi:hypothetical protein